MISRQEVKIANKYFKMFSSHLDIREIQIKTTLKSHLCNQNGQDQEYKRQQVVTWMWEKVNEPLYTVGGSVNYCSHFGNQSRGSQKVDPAISLLGIHSNTLS